MKKINLFCFPYAGSSAMVYRKYSPYINRCINLIPVELPGRGSRHNEKLINKMDDIIGDIYKNINNKIDSTPYAFWGHSMGSIIVYELVIKMMNNNKNLPFHLFLSGSRSPDMKLDKTIHNLSDDEFKEEIVKMGGTPEDFFKNKELVKIFLPVLKSDFQMIETYVFKHHDIKLDIDFTVFNGDNDDIVYDKILTWENHTSKTCNFYNFNGDHFFINDYVKEIADLINNKLILHNN